MLRLWGCYRPYVLPATGNRAEFQGTPPTKRELGGKRRAVKGRTRTHPPLETGSRLHVSNCFLPSSPSPFPQVGPDHILRFCPLRVGGIAISLAVGAVTLILGDIRRQSRASLTCAEGNVETLGQNKKVDPGYLN